MSISINQLNFTNVFCCIILICHNIFFFVQILQAFLNAHKYRSQYDLSVQILQAFLNDHKYRSYYFLFEQILQAFLNAHKYRSHRTLTMLFLENIDVIVLHIGNLNECQCHAKSARQNTLTMSKPLCNVF